jgi:hypothetical protein
MSCPIPTNPDISGIGVRVAIYAQNFLSFVPAFYALFNDGEVDSYELKIIEDQSTTILVTAFAILISTIVQARTYGLSGFDTSVILNLSWMNNTNTFIYFILYIHHHTTASKVEPRWSAWAQHAKTWLSFIKSGVLPRISCAYSSVPLFVSCSDSESTPRHGRFGDAETEGQK